MQVAPGIVLHVLSWVVFTELSETFGLLRKDPSGFGKEDTGAVDALVADGLSVEVGAGALVLVSADVIGVTDDSGVEVETLGTTPLLTGRENTT